MLRCQFYYKDCQGISHKKTKRGFKTKAEAEQWERDFLQQQQNPCRKVRSIGSVMPEKAGKNCFMR